MKNKIKTVVLVTLGLVVLLCGCSENNLHSETKMWDESIGTEDWEELEAVEHDDKKHETYSVPNEIKGNSFVYVYVCGQVNRPGVYELPQGSRIYEAIECAGGMTEGAVKEAVNQALPVEDGMQITVPDKDEILQVQMAAEKDGLINLNTADVNLLTTLKGIGKSRAEEIVKYREENGKFDKIEDIMNVPGIKQGSFEKIKDSITVY